jgi:hypothetical protein
MGSPTPTRGPDHRLAVMEMMAIAAAVLIALAIVRPINVGVVVAATLALAASRSMGQWRTRRVAHTLTVGLFASAVFVLAALIVDRGLGALTVTVLVLAPMGGVVAWIAVRANLVVPRVRWVGAGLLVAMIGLIGLIWVGGSERPDIDVLDLHVSAAEQLAAGANPYVTARAKDTSPRALPGDEVVGYPYPPLTMLPYVSSQWLLGDPRWAGVIAMAVGVLLVARPWEELSGRGSGALLAMGVAITLQPALGYVLRQGWTEPLAVPLLAGVGLLWRKHPAAAAVLLGLTLGLKQYWIVALPLLIVWSDAYRWKRFAIAASVAALSLLVAVAPNPAAAWESLVLDLLAVPARVDSLGFAGLGWDTPFPAMLVLVVAVAVWMGWRGGTATRFQLGVAATLATAFLLGSQAFINYWLLVATIAMVAVAVNVADAPDEIEHTTGFISEPAR